MRKSIYKAAALILAGTMCAGLTACGGKTQETKVQETAVQDKKEAKTGETGKEQASEAGKESAAPKKKVSLVLATNWGEGDSKYHYFYPKFQEFQEANADTMDITLETYSTEDYKTKIKTQTASGDLPDVFTYWGGAMMTDMVEAGLLLDVEEYFNASDQVKRDGFEPTSFGYYTASDGKTYGIPIESTRGIFLANKQLFEENGLDIPKTYEELLKTAKTFNEKGIIPIAIGSNGGTPSEFFFSELYGQYDGAAKELEELAATRTFNTGNALKVANNIKDMIDQKMFPADTVANGGWAASLQLYTDRKAAMTYTYPWMFESIPEEIQEASEIVPLPMLPDADIDPAGIMTGFTVYGFEINKASFEDAAKHDAMVKLCDFLASDELSAELTKSGMIPAKNIEIDMDSQKLIFKKMMEYAQDKKLISVHYTTMPDQDAVNMMDSSLDEFFINALTPQELIDKVQAVLDKNNK